MISTVMDVAGELVEAAFHAVSRDEAIFHEPRLAAGFVPDMATFIVETVEGRRFRVSVTEEKP